MATMAADFHESSNTLSEAEAWRAVERHDKRFDRKFVYAVRTTGVYCRPSCPSRRPARANVEFFADPDAAERGGFRACLRCDPRSEQASRAHSAVARARTYLDAHQDRAVPLGELASVSGMSASHLQRTFKQLVGVSPREYQTATRVRALKAHLRAGETVSRATFEAGFGSSSRVYERANHTLGMTPAAYRRGGAGVRIVYTIASAPIGRVLVASTDRGVCAVVLGDTDDSLEAELRADFARAQIERADDAHREWVEAVVSQIRAPGAHGSSPVPLDAVGTDFQLEVWRALQTIPPGERRSYRQVAESIGRPRATRAVARACATNHVAVIIPCHRVVREDGDLAGYRWGIERKRKLLALEKK